MNSINRAPWFSKNEWTQAYERIFINNSVDHQQAYDHLLTWKARMPFLPSGIDCTLCLLRALVKEAEYNNQLANGEVENEELDLRNTYLISLLRFLNHVCSAAHDFSGVTLYKTALQMNIPDWIVNLRNEAVHGSNLPPLSTLHAAIQFSLQWIHINYWTQESLKDVIITNSNEKALKELFDIWVAVRLYAVMGLKYVDQLPDNHVRKYLGDSHMKISGLTNESFESRNSEDECFGEHEDETNTDVTTRTLLSKMENKLRSDFKVILKKLHACKNIANILTDHLIQSDIFFPTDSVLMVFNNRFGQNLEQDHLMDTLMLFFRPILNVIVSTVDIFPSLLKSLRSITVNDSYVEEKRLLAALWIRDLCCCAAKSREAVLIHQKMTGNRILSEKLAWKRTCLEVDKKCGKLKQLPTFRLKENATPICDIEELKQILSAPNEYSSIYLSSLLCTLEPPLPNAVQQKILHVVTTYTKGCSALPCTVTNNEVKTLADLKQNIEKSGANMPMEIDNCSTGNDQLILTGNDVDVQWKKAEGHWDWSKVPFGKLPWQLDDFCLNFFLPLETKWTASVTSHSETHRKVNKFIVKKHLGMKVEWNNLRKRQTTYQKKKLKMQQTNAAKTAIEHLLSLNQCDDSDQFTC